ncbi:MAG: hypothetical protein QG652_429, partial [Pseudomonadota bacterium]|nr:hypothetical protein [Pseudomonadota bacterium]
KYTDGSNTADANCKSRTDFDTQVWRYNLYHAVDGMFNGQAVTGGQRVELNSGFPFTYDSDSNGSNDAYGFVGYHGVWSEAGDLANGTSITKFDYSSNATSAHTIRVSPGKLMRRTAHNEQLSSFQGDEFQYWGQHPGLNNMFGQWVVTVDSNNAFQITGALSFGDNGPQVSTTIDDDGNTGTAEVNVAATLTLTDNQNLWLWSDALGGNVVYLQDDAIAANARTVTFYAQETVSPSDSLFANGNVTLYCYDRCLIGGLTPTDITNANGNESALYHTGTTPFLYTLTSSNGQLTLTDNSNSNAVVSTAGLDLTSVNHDWGINTGEMVTATLDDASQPWLIFNEAVTLRWETGNNNWNRLVTVTDAQGNVASFDRPLQFTYTHLTANDANGSSSHNNKKFMLQYGGAGELWGFPWEEDAETHRWQSSVTLADGVVLTAGNNTFLVKAIEKQQTMQDDNANCGTLNVDSLFTSLPLPAADSTTGAVSFTLADKPVVTDAPAVIEGELQ